MTDDPIRPSEEDRLRELLERAAAGVPIPRSEAPSGASSSRNGRSSRLRWLAAAAAMLLVAGGLTWVATESDDGQLTAGPDDPGSTWCEPGDDVLAVDVETGDGFPRVMLSTGSADVRAVAPDWVATAPSLAPGAEAVALTRADGDYESSGPEATTIWTLRADGTGARQVTHGPFDDHPDWSPDGRTIVYASSDRPARGERRIMTVPAGGGTATSLTAPGDANDFVPTWSPDGSTIAYVRIMERLDGADSSVWTIRPDGSDATELAVLEGEVARTLSWSPDGRTVTAAIGGAASSTQGAVSIAVPGGDARVLAGSERLSGFEWAADSGRAYVLQPGATGRIAPHHARVANDGTLDAGAPVPGFGERSVYSMSVARCSDPTGWEQPELEYPTVGDGLPDAPASARAADAIAPVTGGFLAVTRSDQASEVLRYDVERDEWLQLPPAFRRLSNSVVIAARDDVAVVLAALCWQPATTPGSRCLSDSFGAWTWDEATGSWIRVSMPPDLNQDPIEDERPSMQAVGVVDGTAHFVVDGQHMTVDGTDSEIVGERTGSSTETLCLTDDALLTVTTAGVSLDPTGVTITRADGSEIEVPDALTSAPSGPAGEPGDIWQAECVPSGVVIGTTGMGGTRLWRLRADDGSWQTFDGELRGQLAAAVERPDGRVTVALNVLNVSEPGTERTRIETLDDGSTEVHDDLDGWTEELVDVGDSVVAAVRPSATGSGDVSYRLVP